MDNMDKGRTESKMRVWYKDLLRGPQKGECLGMTYRKHIGHHKNLPAFMATDVILRCMRSTSFLPKVYAAESSQEEKPSEITTMDRLQTYRNNSNIDIESEIQEYLATESGIDRLREMYSKDERGYIHQELRVVLQMSSLTASIAALFGAVSGAKEARETFVEKHKLTKWKTKFIAARAYQDNIIASSMKQAAKNGFRYFFFCGLVMGIGQSISVYRNKSGLIEYPIAFGICGILWRMNFGVRGMCVAGGLGVVLGTVAGAMSYGMRVAAGDTTEQRHNRELKRMIMDQRDELAKIFSPDKEQN